MTRTLLAILLAVATTVPAKAQTDGGGIGTETTIEAVDESVQPAERLKGHVVAIYDQDGNLLGSGASISAKGLILTAKHILELDKLPGQLEPVYRLSVEVLGRKDPRRRDATLVATHPHMDLAILHAPTGAPVPPLFVGPAPAAADGKWFVIGHPVGIDPSDAELFHSESGDWTGVQFKHGRILLGKAVDTGMSGGPLIVNNKIIGVVSHAGSSTSVAPISPALDYFRLLGFSANAEGLITMDDHIGRLASKVQDYERILSEIQVDVQWLCQLDATWSSGGPDRLPDKLELRLINEKKLRSQPDMFARLKVDFVTEIEVLNGQTMTIGPVDDVEWVKGAENQALFENFLDEIGDKLRVTGLSNAALRLHRAEILTTISSISGRGYIKVEPEPHAVCCTFPDLHQSIQSTNSGHSISASAVGQPCQPSSAAPATADSTGGGDD